MRKKVSIIVPFYNSEKYLKKCIDSIISQDYDNIEIILINDGSNDNSEEICNQYINNKNVMYVSKKNGGVSSARNLGIKLSTGDYVTFIDSDDFIEKNFVSELVSSIECDNFDMSICNYHENNDINICEIIKKNELFISIMNKKLYKGYLWNKLYKLDIIKNNNLKFDENIHICEDLLFNYQYVDKCNNNFIFTNKKLYHYVQHESSAMHKKLTNKYLTIIKSYKEIKKILKKNNIDLTEFSVSYLKVLADLIYKNNLLKEKIDIKNVYSEIEICYKEIKKMKIGIKRRIEIFLYYKFPIFVGKLKNLKK